MRTVAIGGLGAIGFSLAEALTWDPRDTRLIAVSARDLPRARARVAHLDPTPRVVAAAELAEADVVIEAAPAACFDEIARPAIEQGRTLVVASAGALLSRLPLLERARETGARIVVPSGALAGLDALKAASLDAVRRVSLETRKPPSSLAGAPHLARIGFDVGRLERPACVFRGDALEAVAAFPANANVVAALALAGVGPARTEVEIWADPTVARNSHVVRVDAAAATLELRVETEPSAANPRTSRLAPFALLACIYGLDGALRVGT